MNNDVIPKSKVVLIYFLIDVVGNIFSPIDISFFFQHVDFNKIKYLIMNLFFIPYSNLFFSGLTDDNFIPVF